MTSIYQQALGADFQKLHPHIQKRFGFCSADHVAAIGQGVMTRVWHGARRILPFLHVGSWRNIMFPEQGQNIPFTIQNYAFVDELGRETMTWLRTFNFQRTHGRCRDFDAYMVYAPERGGVVDYLGTHQHLAVDIAMSVDGRGGLCLRSGAQRFYEGWLGFAFPMLLSGYAQVCEWFDDAAQRFRIEVNVSNPKWGALFGYEGCFEVKWRSVDQVPFHALPKRIEARV